MATGTILKMNSRNGMFLVQIDSGEYAVFELLDSISLEIGEKVRGDLDALGGETLVYVSTGETFEAYGQSGPSSLSACNRLM